MATAADKIEEDEFHIEDFDIDNKEFLGAGGCGTTFKVRCKKDDQFYALKKTHSNANFCEDTEKELALLSRIKHENIIGFFNVVIQCDRQCLVLEYAEYGDLHKLLHKKTNDSTLKREDKEKIIREICSGLFYLHHELEKPVRHGDIKSPNILLCRRGEERVAKLADFGLSEELTKTESESTKCSIRWAAPEMFHFEETKPIKTKQSDVWAMGAVVYELWTECLPYSTIPNEAVSYTISKKMKPYPHDPDTDSKVPEAYRVFLTNCFKFNHKTRWTIEEAHNYLESLELKKDGEDDNNDPPQSVWTSSNLPLEVRDRYTEAVTRFISELNHNEGLFEKAKGLFRTEFGIGLRQRLKSPCEFIDFLEQRTILSPLDTSQLEKRLRYLGEEGERLAGLFSNQPSVQPPPHSEQPPTRAAQPRPQLPEESKTPDCKDPTERAEISEEPKEKEPPDNFRNYPVAPTEEELTNSGESVFLRRNKVQGKYKSVDDYLDVHFRLMREDFVIPLRKGINDLKNFDMTDAKMPVRQVHIYRSATVLYPVCLRNGIGHVVRLNNTQIKNVCWERNKLFMYGSLLCFFLEDYSRALFAIVAQRDVNALRCRGEITVQFITESLFQGSLDEKFILIESSAYFEAYRHVLTRLQVLTEVTFPFTEHIVFCDSIVKPPKYLLSDNENDEDLLVFDFQCITEEKNDTELKAKPLDLDAWPSKEKLGLDASQHSALKTAITHRIALIQGPPGAGKTFMGLKITKLLLENVVKRQKNFGPILVISYTNHALDQFLEGIADFPEVKIVRVGSQSKSERLSRFTLMNIRQEYIDGHKFSRESRGSIKRLKQDIQQLYEDIMKISAKLRATGDHVANLNVLKEFARTEHYGDIVGSAQSSQVHDKMKEWLLETFAEELAIQEFEALSLSTPETTNKCGDDGNDGDESSQFADEAMIETTRRKLEGDDEKNDTGKKLDQKVKELVGKDFIDFDSPHPKSENKKDESQSKFLHTFIQRQLDSDDCMSEEEEKSIDLCQKLSSKKKWRLYRLWRHRYRLSLHTSLKDLKKRYDAQCKRMEKEVMHSDRLVLSSRQVIAMTTTGAARYGEILSALKPKIVIVEEAAEVLESHVVVALSESCEHLILIGDHKQLRPKNTTHEMAKTYKLDVSLFERFIRNKFHFNTLSLQHRMRPEIADLLRQEVLYPKLEDHDSVMYYPDIKGIAHNFFFLSHGHEESHDEFRSYSNDFEARYADRLCKHLLMQGYEPKTITILTLYSGQHTQLTRQRTISEEFRNGLKVAVVDNYQGEENNIIILSLVRSNEKRRIGFTGINNRICVAISRARMGLYVLGNFTQFRTASALWAKVVEKAEAKNLVGPDLELTCQLHPKDSPIPVRSEKDFDERSPDGGCARPCGVRLECGHVCSKACHPTDREHKEYKCQKPVEVTWKDCGHQVPCFKANVFEKYCKEKCEHTLSCGHKCQNKCGEPHTSDCTVMKTIPSSFCIHKVSIKCSSQNKEGACRKPCKETLSCDHQCSGFCSKCCEGRIHEACRKKCNHTLACGHQCRESHPRECPPCEKRCELHCGHSQCALLCGQQCIPCMEKCVNQCQHRACSKLCREICDSPPCDRACTKRFSCSKCKENVECLGLCGEKCIYLCRSCDALQLTQSYMNLEDKNNANARFIRLETCQHVFEVSGLDKWMHDEAVTTVGMKRCPRTECQKTVTLRSCMRYMNQVRKNIAEMRDVNDIVADDNKLETRRKDLIEEARRLNLKNLEALSENDKFLPSFHVKLKRITSVSEIFHYAEALSLLKNLERHSKQIVRSQAVLENDLRNAAKHLLDGLLSAFNRPMTSGVLEQCRMETLRFGDLQQICRFHSHPEHRAECERLLTEYISDWTVPFSREVHGLILRQIEKIEQKAEAKNK